MVKRVEAVSVLKYLYHEPGVPLVSAGLVRAGDVRLVDMGRRRGEDGIRRGWNRRQARSMTEAHARE